MKRALLLLLATGAAACGLSQTLGPRASHDLRCEVHSLTYERLGHGGVVVTGCGRQATYVGVNDQWVLNSEIRSGVGPRRAETSPRLPPSVILARSGNGHRAPTLALAHDGDRVAGVRSTFTSIDSTLQLLYIPSRSRESARLSVESHTAVPLHGCERFQTSGSDSVDVPLVDGAADIPLDTLAIAFRRATPRARFCGRTWLLTEEDAAGWARFLEAAQAASIPASPPTPPAVEAEPATTDPGRAIRTRLGDEIEVIRSCAARAGTMAIEASWDAAGQVTLRMRGEHDAAVDECIMAAIGDWHLDAAQAGHLIHVLR